MAGSLAAIITIPIVVAIALFSWIFAVLWANRHPRWAHHEAQGQQLQTEVRGGAFQAVEGGRQLMPIPERRPAGVPGPRSAVATESYHPSGAHSSTGQPAAGQHAGQSGAAEAPAETAPEPASAAGTRGRGGRGDRGVR
jgi:hypothetical protein